MEMKVSGRSKPELLSWFIFALFAAVLTASFIRLTWSTGDESRYFLVAQSIGDGKGLTSLFAPEPVPDWITPPGYPLFLAGIFALTGPSPVIAKVASATLHLACAMLLLLFLRLWLRDCSAVEHTGLAAIGSLTVFSLYFGWMVYSESLFICLLLLTLIQIERNSTSTWTGALLAGLLAGLATLVRPVGLALLPAGVLFYGYRRQGLALLAYSASYATCIAPYVLRSFLLTGRPLGHMAMIQTESADTSWAADFIGGRLAALGTLVPRHLFHAMPGRFFYHLFDERNIMEMLRLDWISPGLLFALGLLMCLGWLTSLRRMTFPALLFLFFMLIIGSEEVQIARGVEDRLFAPLMPLGAVFTWLGVRRATNWLTAKDGMDRSVGKVFIAFACVYILLTSAMAGASRTRNELRQWGRPPLDPDRIRAQGTEFDRSFARFIEAGQWIGKLKDPRAVVVSRLPRELFMASSQPGISYFGDPIRGTTWEIIQHYHPERPVYVVEDAFPPDSGFGRDRVHALSPILREQQNRLELLYETEEPMVRVWKLRP